METAVKFEICVDSVAGVRAAVAAGADRVELCADLFEGGITPSRGTTRQARTVGGIGLHVIIRPRGGDFVFDDDEMAAMLADIDTARQEGADGVVIGVLTPEAEIDAPRTRALIAAAGPLAVTFHRAFDMTPDPHAALDTLIGLGVGRILTSGQEATVLEGLPLIKELIGRAGDRVIIMPGGGITERNIGRIVAEAHPAEVHFAALRGVESPVVRRRDNVFMGGELRAPEYNRLETSGTILAAVMGSARSAS
ncbi:MAG: copper homeostasis protein CutC [Parafilimonas terrae]|nr:copper homeostasis protein CutC [Parafilimonas terrae]